MLLVLRVNREIREIKVMMVCPVLLEQMVSTENGDPLVPKERKVNLVTKETLDLGVLLE